MTLDWILFGENTQTGMILFRLCVSVLLGALIGMDRETKNRPAGIRTHALVCIGATLIALIEQETVAYVAELGSPHSKVIVGRITSTVVSGVGFLGAGTIVFSEHRIKGLTTAASLWCTACLGIAIGAGYTRIALIVGILIMVVLRFLQKVIRIRTYKQIEIRFRHRHDTLDYLNHYFESMKIEILDVDFHTEINQNGDNVYTSIYSLSLKDNNTYTEMMETFSEYTNIIAVRTRNA